MVGGTENFNSKRQRATECISKRENIHMLVVGICSSNAQASCSIQFCAEFSKRGFFGQQLQAKLYTSFLD